MRRLLSTDLCNDHSEVRFEDMSPTGRLVLLKQDDGDMIVSAINEHGEEVHVEFCTPMSGGGQSSHTWAALLNLRDAMKKDNAERSQQREFGDSHD
jgi:hypothetical protein